MSWSRLPIFVLGRRLDRGADAARRAGPDLDALDGRRSTGPRRPAFFNAQAGGSPYLYQNLFWIFGHPEVYILALPGYGDRARDPAGVLAQAAVGLPARGHRHARDHAALSWLVWQHHLFVSGINADLRPFYMLSTELISLPDRVHLHLRARHALARADPVDGADAVRARVVLQLPDRRPVRRLPLRRAERRDDARQLLLDGALPLHDHGRAALLVLRGDLLLGAEDDRLRRSTSAGEDPLLVDVHRVQLDLRRRCS